MKMRNEENLQHKAERTGEHNYQESAEQGRKPQGVSSCMAIMLTVFVICIGIAILYGLWWSINSHIIEPIMHAVN